MEYLTEIVKTQDSQIKELRVELEQEKAKTATLITPCELPGALVTSLALLPNVFPASVTRAARKFRENVSNFKLKHFFIVWVLWICFNSYLNGLFKLIAMVVFGYASLDPNYGIRGRRPHRRFDDHHGRGLRHADAGGPRR